MFEMEGHVARVGDMRNAYKTLERKPGTKIQLWRPRYRCAGNIKVVLNETGCGLNTAGSGYGSVADSFEHSNEPSVFIKGREFLD